MIAACSDNSVDDNEMNLLKDYFYEECITEQEWREINYFQHREPTREEHDKIINDIMNSIKSPAEKKELMNAVREVIESDGILKQEEKALLEMIENVTQKNQFPAINNIIQRIKILFEKKIEDTENEDRTVEFSKNPASPLLKSFLEGRNPGEIETIAAKIGLMIIVARSDMELSDKEIETIRRLIGELCSADDRVANDIFSRINKIPDNYFEIAYLSRIITDSTDINDRIALLSSLFRVARADGVYDEYEDKYLRIVSNSLFIPHSDFVAVKCSQ